jgi:hypothetical protein
VNELVRPLQRRVRAARMARRKSGRVLVVEALGPLTILVGVLWALAQPERVVFLHRDGKGFYDYLVQGPLLVVLVGLAFALLIAPGLAEDVEAGDDGAPR